MAQEVRFSTAAAVVRFGVRASLVSFAGTGYAWAEATDLQVRVAWGGGTARQWQGTMAIEGGTFSELSYLGLDADENATLYLEKNIIQIRQRSNRDYDGFDIRAVGSSACVLKLEIAPSDHPEELQRIEIPLSELVTGYRHVELDAHSNQLLAQRVSGDQLRTKFDRTSLVFAPGETFEFQVTPHLIGLEDRSNLRYQIQLFRARQDKQLWDQSEELIFDANGNANNIGPIKVPLPEAEGVYEVVISIFRKRFRDTFVGSKPLLKRNVQLVVVAAKSPSAKELSWELIDTLDPNHASWMEWLTRIPKLPLLPDFRQEPLGNGKSTERRHLDQDLVELAPGGWQAYPISTREAGQPHILEVEYPSDVPQTISISVIEPNAVGKVVPLGVDSGVDVTESSAGRPPKMLRHRLLFWPRTSTPLVLLANRRDDSPALFGKIRIYAGAEVIPPAAEETSTPASRAAPTRLLAAYFDRPLFPENFSAPEMADEWSGRSLKDWVTFYEGGRRLVEYLKQVGYNGAIISVACQGGTIYPSQLLTPIPKYDSGVFFATGQDPLQKDVLEMLFRLFDREGLTLIPAVHFSSTLNELEEALRRQPDAAEGIVLVDQLGKSWFEGYGTSRGSGPHYNPLDPRVQAAMRHVLNEITDRYGQHAAFGGLSLQLGPDTYALLPGEQWGKDRVTVKRFEKDYGPATPEDSKLLATGSWSRDRGRSWLKWRAKSLTDFQRDMLEDLRERRADARLYLLCGDMFTNPAVQSMLRPTLPNRLRVDEAMLQMGFDTQQYADQKDLILFRPERIAPRTPLATQAVNINLATNAAADHAFSEIQPAASLFYHERLPLSLPSFDTQSPFGRENTRTVLFTLATPSAESNRQRFVHHLALRDVQYMADGGWMLPLGQEDVLKDLFDTLAQLPARPFETVTPKTTGLPTQPLVVRTLVHQGKTHIYVINDAPWPVSAEIDMHSQQPCQLQAIGRRPMSKPKWMGGQLTWKLDLEPFDLVAAELSSDQVQVDTWRVPLDRPTFAQLRQQVDELDDRITMLERPEPINVLANPGFEAAPDRLPGWIHAQGAGITILPDANEHFEGGQSLKMTNRGLKPDDVAWIRSDPFDPPKTGRVAVIVRLKTDDPNKQPPLRLAIEGKYLNGSTYYLFFNVGAGARVEPLSRDWGAKPFVMLISDLPVNELANIRVGFDLMGAGNVWIDDVHVYDRWFPKNERDDLTIMRVLATRSLNMGNLTDCQRILSGYWSQFLLEYISPDAAQVAQRPADAPSSARAFPPPQPKQAENKPSMFNKVKKPALQGHPASACGDRAQSTTRLLHSEIENTHYGMKNGNGHPLQWQFACTSAFRTRSQCARGLKSIVRTVALFGGQTKAALVNREAT